MAQPTRRHEYHMSPTSFYNQRSSRHAPRRNSHDHRPTTPSALTTTSYENNDSPSSRSQTPPRRRAPHPTLPSLPRFHPANYAVTSSPASAFAAMKSPTSADNPSTSSTFDHSSTHNTGPLSPHTSSQLRQYPSDAQRQLYLYHRELLSLNRVGSSPSATSFSTSYSNNPSLFFSPQNGMLSPSLRNRHPQSPYLAPLGSPGPVTPLVLEGEAESGQSEGYFLARMGSREGSHGSRTPSEQSGVNEIVDNLIRRETSTMS